MAPISTSSTMFMLLFIIMCSSVLCNSFKFDPFADQKCGPTYPSLELPVYKQDRDLLQFAQNPEHLEADFFLISAYGHGLDKFAPELTLGGPPPIGGQIANLDNLTWSIIATFGLQEIGHLRALKSTVGGIPRPELNLGASNFAKLIDAAFGYKLDPPFDPYRNSMSYMIGSYVVPYVGENAYTGANAFLKGYLSKRLLAGLLGAEAGQDAVIRTYLYERAEQLVSPYEITVAEFTAKISKLRDRLGMCGLKDEGLFVPPELGAEMKTSSNILSLNRYSLAYARTPKEVLRILYGTGNEHIPGGFFPEGGNGRIAREYLL